MNGMNAVAISARFTFIMNINTSEIIITIIIFTRLIS